MFWNSKRIFRLAIMRSCRHLEGIREKSVESIPRNVFWVYVIAADSLVFLQWYLSQFYSLKLHRNMKLSAVICALAATSAAAFAPSTGMVCLNPCSLPDKWRDFCRS
jgi:hypothetical protein